MPLVHIDNVNKYGVVTDLESYDLPPEAWSLVQNVRFTKRGAEKFHGHEEFLGGWTFSPYWLTAFYTSASYHWVYAGLTRLGMTTGAAHVDVSRYTSVLGDADYNFPLGTNFSFAQLGELPLVFADGNSEPPQSWNATNLRFEDLPNWQADTFADIATVVDRHVVVMRVKKSGVAFNPRMVKWSQPADPGTYPSSWDETDPANTAGEVTLAETPGAIVASAQLGNSMLIYKEDSIISMRYVGGQSIFRFDTVFSEFGAIGRNAVGVLENAHVVVTLNDIFMHNGSTFESVIDAKNRDLFFEALDADYLDKLNVQVLNVASEVWFSFPGVGSDGTLNTAWVWNYKLNVWSRRDLQDFDFMAVGFIDTSSVSLVMDTQNLTFNEGSDTFDKLSTEPVLEDFAAIRAADSKLFKLNSSDAFDGGAFTSRLERTGLALVGRDRQDEWLIDMDSRKFIRRIHPRLKASGPVKIYVGGQEHLDGVINWTGPFSFDPNTQTHLDCRVNARFFAFRIETTTDLSWELLGYSLDLDVIGRAQR